MKARYLLPALTCQLLLALTGITGATTLQIVPTQDQVQLSWPSGATTYSPESSDILGSGKWVPVTNSATISNGVKSITLSAPTNAMFFRLRAPGPTAPLLSSVIAPPTPELLT